MSTTIENLQLATNTVAPLVGAASDLLARLMAGTVQLAQAKSELVGVLVLAGERLDAHDDIFAARDKREAARIAAGEITKIECTRCGKSYPYGTAHTC